MKHRLIGAIALVLLALGAGFVAHRLRDAPLRANEAIAVINATDGIHEGTPVVRGGFPAGWIGHVARVERREGRLVLRLRLDNAGGIARRRGDAVSIWGSPDEKIIAIVSAPTYEKPGRASDTLFAATPDRRRPADVQSLLGSLYRPDRRSTPDSSVRR